MRVTGLTGWIAALVLAGGAGSGRLHAQSSYSASPQAIVHVADGTLQGAMPGPGVRAFLGIPYARPPVGALRWQPPQPPQHWSGSRAALQHGAPCPQQRFGWNNSSAEHGSEDCLYLNVWAPAGAVAKPLPVMVYIHGGSNVAGSASEELSNGLTLVPRGVVLVTLNYRLGIFGFFRAPELDAESPHQASGDYGLLDQVSALRWVRRNIASFGGDPRQVTIFGQSAGSVDVGSMMASPLARGLFAGAIEESGTVLGLMPTASRAQSEDAWSGVAAALGPDLAAMRGRTTAEVLAADAKAPKPQPGQPWGFRGASVDGWVLPATPAAIFRAGREAPVPLMIGSNVQEIVPKNEPDAALTASIHAAMGPDGAKLEAIYAQPGAPLLGNASARWATDHDFRCPVRVVAGWHASHGYPTYVYQFDHPLPGKAVAEHSSELFYVFHYFPQAQGTPAAQDVALSATVQTYWTSFAATASLRTAATPDHAGLPAWPRFAPETAAYLHFPAGAATPDVQQHLGGAACDVIASHLAQ